MDRVDLEAEVEVEVGLKTGMHNNQDLLIFPRCSELIVGETSIYNTRNAYGTFDPQIRIMHHVFVFVLLIFFFFFFF